MDAEGKLLVNLTRGNVVCDHLVIADKARRRMRGLLGRDSLPGGEGLLLQPAPSIHTAFMRFTIDAVFVDGTLGVKKIVPELRPWRMASARGAKGVVELAAGEAKQRGVVTGDQLGVVEVTQELGAYVDSSVWRDEQRHADASGSADETGATSNSLPVVEGSGEGSAGSRVLVVGADRRFRSVAAALLTRRGCAVTLADRTSNVAELVSREGADVVVLDAGASIIDAARAAAQLEMLYPPAGLVIVADEAEQSFSSLPVLPKWGSFAELWAAIERVRATRSLRYSGGSRS